MRNINSMISDVSAIQLDGVLTADLCNFRTSAASTLLTEKIQKGNNKDE